MKNYILSVVVFTLYGQETEEYVYTNGLAEALAEAKKQANAGNRVYVRELDAETERRGRFLARYEWGVWQPVA